jgi:hypothetical protein
MDLILSHVKLLISVYYQQGGKEDYITRSFMICTPYQMSFGGSNRERDTCGRQERCIQGFFWEETREGDHLEDLGVDRRIILKWGGTDCIALAQDMERCWAFVNTVMNLQIA